MIDNSNSLNVITFGRFSVLRGQNPLSGGNWNRRRIRELFKILLTAEQHRLHREQIQELLWPESSLEQATNSFGKTLYLLRRALEPDLGTGRPSMYISLEHDTLSLIPDSTEIDADLFESRARQLQIDLQKGQVRKEQLQSLLHDFDAVLSLYGGTYLPDDLYEEWAQRKRDRLRRTYSWLLEHAAQAAVAAFQGERACEYLLALLECNNADEQTYRELMLLYARMGRRREAVGRYQFLCDVLQEELSADPLPETRELYEAIQAGRVPVDLAPTGRLPELKPVLLPLGTPHHIHAHAIADEHPHEGPVAVLPNPVEAREGANLSRPTPEAERELIGRKTEIQRLQKAYALVREGRSRVFFVSGEAGIGKTRLAHELSIWAQRQQATVLQGSCYEMSGGLPYQPIIDMLTVYIRATSPEQLGSTLGTRAVDLAKIIPELRAKLPDLPLPELLGPEVERRNLYNSVAGTLQIIAAKHPLVLILDDLQWADIATLQLLSYLLLPGTSQPEHKGTSPFFLLLYRADEVHETHPLRSLLSARMRAGYTDEIRLRRLKEDEVQQLLTQMVGHDIPPSFSEEIYKHTEGNPFFILESVRTLVEEGKVKKINDRWQTTVAVEELALPQSVRLLIERRLANLSPECRVSLAYAAVLGRQFHSTLLSRARNLPEEKIAEHIDDAIRAQLLAVLDEHVRGSSRESVLSQDADLMFTHDKIREVLALWLNPLRRRSAHRQIAQAIETCYASHLRTYYGRLAYHYQMAEEISRAVEYLRKAASQAIDVYAFADAASYLEKAIELLPGEDNRAQRADLLGKLSIDVYIYIGRPDKAIEAGITACQLWQELGHTIKEAESRLDVSFSFHWMGRERDSIEYIKRALACLEDTPDVLRLRAKAHVQWGLSATVSGKIPVALEQLQIADGLHAQSGGNDPFISVVALWARSWCAYAAGTAQEMLDYALQSAALCRSIRMFAWEPMMTYSAAWALMLLGRLNEGAQIARSSLEAAQNHNAVGAQGWANLVLAFLALQQGEWDAADVFGNKAAEIATLMHDTSLLARVFWGRSIATGWRGNWKRAIELSLEGLRILASDGESSLVYPYILLRIAKAHFHVNNIDGAQAYLDQCMQFALEHQYRQLPAIGLRIQGNIWQARGEFDQATTCFEQSLEGLAALNDQVEYARTQLAYGLFLRTCDQASNRERGSAMLQQAHATLDRLQILG